MMAKALTNPAVATVPDSCAFCIADAPPCGSATMCELHADVIGQPHGRTTTLGVTDGSCPDLPPPTEGRPDSAPPPERPPSRESDSDVMQTTPMGGAARCGFLLLSK